MLTEILIGFLIVETGFLFYVVLSYKGGINMKLLKKKKKEILTPPPAEVETPTIAPQTEHEVAPQQKAQEKTISIEEQIERQKEGDREYYNKIYSNTYEIKDFKKDGQAMTELANLAYGILSEFKTLNIQLSQLIQILGKK